MRVKQKRDFNLLLAAQSLSAFSDNAVYAVIIGILLELVKAHQITLSRFGIESAVFANCLFLPYVALAPLVGWLSDRFLKRDILVAANVLKAAGCLLGLLGLLAGTDLLLLSYLLIGIGAAVYSPSKYGIIPELAGEEGLVRANAAMEMTTIISILLGIVGGGILFDRIGATASFSALVLAYGAAAGLNTLMSRSGRPAETPPFRRSFRNFRSSTRTIFLDPLRYVPILGTAVFWFAASFTKLNLQTWGQQAAHLSTATELSLLALWLSLGIVLGSYFAGRRYRTGEIQGTWRFGLAMGLVILLLSAAYVNYPVLVAELILLGTVGGIFLIPLNAVIQAKAERRDIGTVIAIQNMLENGAMLASAVLFWIFNAAALSPIATFMLLGAFLCLLNAGWLRWALRNVPDRAAPSRAGTGQGKDPAPRSG